MITLRAFTMWLLITALIGGLAVVLKLEFAPMVAGAALFVALSAREEAKNGK